MRLGVRIYDRIGVRNDTMIRIGFRPGTAESMYHWCGGSYESGFPLDGG